MKSVFTWFKINSMKKIPEKFEFMILSKTRRPKYNLLIDLNVIKSLLKAELLGFIIKNNNVSWKYIAKSCQTALHKLQKTLESWG